jgi:hypothetical protein
MGTQALCASKTQSTMAFSAFEMNTNVCQQPDVTLHRRRCRP